MEEETMTDLIDDLLLEHDDIRSILQLIDAELDGLRQDRQPDWDLLTNAMYYLTQYPDLFHHVREDALFRQLVRRDRRSREFVRDLTAEHAVLRELGAGFLELCEDAVSDTIVSLAELEHRGRRYVAFQQRHMHKEEETAFPRLRWKLSRDDWEMLPEALSALALPGPQEQICAQFRSLRRHISPPGLAPSFPGH
jgi:hemerythrin-like domain-containing protein